MPRAILCSEFFCEPQLWQRLELEYLPRLLAGRHSLAAWSIGCYTGKEPFSLAILLSSMGCLSRFRILATDNDAAVLAKAAQGGPFSSRDIETLIPNERPKYVVGEIPPFYVREEIRFSVEFRRSDIVTEPAPGLFDLLLYRNIEPFFNEDTNRQVCNKIFGALRPGGLLFCSSVDRIPNWAALGFERLELGFFQRPPWHSHS